MPKYEYKIEPYPSYVNPSKIRYSLHYRERGWFSGTGWTFVSSWETIEEAEKALEAFRKAVKVRYYQD